MEKKVLLKEMFDNLLHIWNKSNYWSPKMKSYIYGSTNWVHIVNLVKTIEKIEEIKKEISKLTWEWKKILFVSTKLQWRDAFMKLAKDTGNYYVCEKWVPGLLTNFKTIRKRINTYIKLLKDSETWVFEVLTKKEKASKMLELEKLDKAFKWLKEMKRMPDILFVVDWIYEKQSVKEANTLGITTFAILNTNWNIDTIDYLIPANTNAVKSIEYIVNTIRNSFKVWIKPKSKTIIKKQIQRKISWEKAIDIKKTTKTIIKDKKKIDIKVVDKKVVVDKKEVKLNK